MQYEFRPSRSTADVLTVITDRISRVLDTGFDARLFALDISKAFDKVWHKGLLHKLKGYGLGGRVLPIIKSFLTGRSMTVVINGQSSEVHFINAGVPQGSVLGPTLFLLFINDLPDHILKSFINIFADDTTDYGTTSRSFSHADLATELNSDLTLIVRWGKQWLVTFNASKTKLLSLHHHRNIPILPSISMDNKQLDESNILDKLLGLKITPNLMWGIYIQSIAKDAARMVGSFYRSRDFLSPAAIWYLNKSQIRPKWDIVPTFWLDPPSTNCPPMIGFNITFPKMIYIDLGDMIFF